MLMDNQQVSHSIGFASSHQSSNLMPTSVHALGSWEHQLQFLPTDQCQIRIGDTSPTHPLLPDPQYLCKHLQARTGVSGGGDHDLRIFNPSPSVFIIHMAGHTCQETKRQEKLLSLLKRPSLVDKDIWWPGGQLPAHQWPNTAGQ